jgi:regulator of replication initiation timing
MSEENQAPEGQEEQAPELAPVEIEAMEHGWKPEEDFKADPKNEGKKWRSAEEFMDRKSLFDRIESGNHELKQVKKTLAQLSQHHANVEKVAYEKALAALKAQRKEALAENDLVKAEELRDEMDEMKEKIQRVAPPVEVPAGPPPELVEFKQRNSWYQRDDPMTRYADSVGKDLFEQGFAPNKILQEVEKRTREAFPEKFRNPNRESAPEMVPSGRRANTPQGFRLTEEEERIVKNFVATGIMTREQYIADLKKLRG